MKYWIGVASKDHVDAGKRLGIAQFCHGKFSAAKRLHRGDFLLYYSPSLFMKGDPKAVDNNRPYQKFTAIGQVADDEAVQVEISPDFRPYRRNIAYFTSQLDDVPIRSLLDDLHFIHNKKSWGGVFRFGLIEIDELSFKAIAQAMLGYNPIPSTSNILKSEDT